MRSGEITPPELSGGTFTVSNLGMFGMTAIHPVINLPQAAILGVGAIRPVLARDDAGEIVDRQLVTLTLTCDHRIPYGADAAGFLADIKQLLETPLRIVLYATGSPARGGIAGTSLDGPDHHHRRRLDHRGRLVADGEAELLDRVAGDGGADEVWAGLDLDDAEGGYARRGPSGAACRR